MAYSWRQWRVKRFNGLQLKVNPTDVPDGSSIDCENVYQGGDGIASKRKGAAIMFDQDYTSSTQVDDVGSARLGTTKYYYRFAGGSFQYSTSLTGAVSTISPSPAIAAPATIWTAVLDDKLFFVDGTNGLRYFDGSAIRDSSIYERPTNPAAGSGGTGFDYTYTVDNGLGESPACSTLLVNIGSAASITIYAAAGPFGIQPGNTVRIYSKNTGIPVNFRLVAAHTWAGLGSEVIATAAISDTQNQLYSELGIALNKTAPTGLVGITAHYGRLIGWKDDRVYCSKVTNPHSWPDEQAVQEAFVYGFGIGDEDEIRTCISFRESLFVLKDTKIAAFVGIGPDDTGNNRFSFRRIETNGIGCVAPKSAVIIGEASKTYLIFLSSQGFYASNGNEPTRLGEPIEPEINLYSLSSKQSAVAIHHKKEGFYYAVLGPSNERKTYIFDTREDNGTQVGWFRLSGIDIKCMFYDDDRFLFGTYDGITGSERVNNIASDYQDIKYEFIEPSSVDVGANTITTGLEYTTGDTVKIRSTGTVPVGLTANNVYYIIAISPTVIKIALTAVDAGLGTAIDLTSQGTGTISIIGSKAISAYYTTNFIHLGSPSIVKKVSKPSIIINALASSVSIDVQTAYDWIATYGDLQTLSTGSTDLWGDLAWGSFTWGFGASATPKNVAIARRKFRSISYKFSNSTINQDFNLQGIEQAYDLIRNRGNYAL